MPDEVSSMPSIIFVHGTGARKESYDESLDQIKDHLKRQVIECRWGDECGVRLPKNPVSIPDFDATRAVDQGADEDRELAVWAALYEDPLCELRLLGSKPQSPGGFSLDQRRRPRSSGRVAGRRIGRRRSRRRDQLGAQATAGCATFSVTILSN
jgi:hypothetical protein